MTSLSVPEMTPAEMRVYLTERARTLAFDAVYALWRRRREEGRLQNELAKKLEKNEAWVSRTLKGPANWTIGTLAELTFALDGELEITVRPVEDIHFDGQNYHSYAEYALPLNAAERDFSSPLNFPANASQRRVSHQAPPNTLGGQLGLGRANTSQIVGRRHDTNNSISHLGLGV